jgi:N-acetylneuraminic acid mutarotase
VAAPGNIPGNRYSASSWIDRNGNFWLFGGDGWADDSVRPGDLNDLWKFNPATNEWAWMDGSNRAGQNGVYGSLGTPAPGNIPKARDGASSWTDTSGNFWLFGGTFYDAASDTYYNLNDLWEFNPSTRTWAWMSGSNLTDQPGVYGTLGVPAPGNIPGARYSSVTWSDSNGHLWLFGGNACPEYSCTSLPNDLWEFNPSTNEWTWMGGSNSGVTSGVYGKLGIPAPGNIPGGRWAASSWTDSSGNFWLFGGDLSTEGVFLNDLWEFNPSTGEWTWMSGSNSAYQTGVYGRLQTPAPGNFPGSRSYASSWTDSSGNLWLFGGTGIDVNGAEDIFNDVWEWNPVTNEWAWMDGSLSSGQLDVYGTLGRAAPGNSPGGRVGAVVSTDNYDRIWLFGGGGQLGLDNDLWRYQLPAAGALKSTASALTSSQASALAGEPVTFTASVVSGTATPADGDFVTILLGNTTVLGTATLTGGAGTLTTAALPPGSDSITAIFSGDSTYATSTSNAVILTVTKNNSSTTLASSPNPSSPGQPVTFSATVAGQSGGTPTGTVVLYLDGAPRYYLGLFNGSGSISISSLPSGTYSLSAVYPGDTNFNGSTSNSLTQTVTKDSSSTVLASYPNPSSFAEQVTMTATVAGQFGGTPTGTVTFTTGATTLGTATLIAGTVKFTISALPQGTDSITATYSGDSNFIGSTSNTHSQVVNPETTTPNQWTWMLGSQGINQNGAYGILGTAYPIDTPGARDGPASWTDAGGHLWLFGGKGFDSLGAEGVQNDLWEYTPSTDEWVWVGGSTTAGKPGVYGQSRVAAAGNIPGSRDGEVNWIDSSGSLWLFGGFGVDANRTSGYLNDLWTFNPATNQWTWIGGSTTVGATNGGQPGVYGNLRIAAAANVPGGRVSASSWIDKSGHFWLFGGIGFDANGNYGELNDLWEFNPSTSQWTWMAGRNTESTAGGRFGIYGVLGTAASGNAPGSRHSASAWTDSAGNFWLFGGGGFGAIGGGGVLDDFWEFSPTTNQWTWMAGATTAGASDLQPGVYGTMGTAASGNFPGGRYQAASWIDNSGNFWLLGGNGFDATGSVGKMNDLWEFSPTTGQWTWMGGSNSVGSSGGRPGVYGVQGLPAAGITPGGRVSSATWTDSSGNLWLFGGIGFAANGDNALLNDLWRYQP